MAINESAARGFAAGADAYERGRPSYAPEAIERLVRELRIGPGSRVLDLAAGTGKLTRQLVDTGATFVAVEPVAEMRAKLAEAAPSAEVLDGVAEAIPLPDRSVDAVVVGQAFHWFDGALALPEIHRVLRPSGGLGLIWQSRDPVRPWVEHLEEIIERADDGDPGVRNDAWKESFESSPLFDPLESDEIKTVPSTSPESIVDSVASISYIAAKAEPRRREVLDEVRALLASDPETAGRDVIELPSKANIFWTRARA